MQNIVVLLIFEYLAMMYSYIFQEKRKKLVKKIHYVSLLDIVKKAQNICYIMLLEFVIEIYVHFDEVVGIVSLYNLLILLPLLLFYLTKKVKMKK